MNDQKQPSAGPEHEDVDYDAWFRAQVEIGLAAARAGMVLPHEEVKARFSLLHERAVKNKIGGD
jgi:predicted transcriptional regulator